MKKDPENKEELGPAADIPTNPPAEKKLNPDRVGKYHSRYQEHLRRVREGRK